ncbi:MAG: hypothetical protein K6T27_05865, partial [Thermoleophilum sp.]|nr:hypothetical protein [Thermoleophilum sp.]
MSEADVETLLRSALRPVEPSLGLRDRLENRLRGVRDAAADAPRGLAVIFLDGSVTSLRQPSQTGRAAGCG